MGLPIQGKPWQKFWEASCDFGYQQMCLTAPCWLRRDLQLGCSAGGRSVITISAVDKMILRQFDVSTAFLFRAVVEQIYMMQPEEYLEGTNHVCCLKHSM